MTLHVFNPEHDIALARDDQYFTPPKAARTLRDGCGFLPALWAGEDDYVLVADVGKAEEHLVETGVSTDNVNFITASELHDLPTDIAVEPWGWDSALCFQLARHGLNRECLPGDAELREIRRLSSRTFSSRLLKLLRNSIDDGSIFTVGQSIYVSDIKDVAIMVAKLDMVVLKEPWSCSGRGVRYIASAAGKCSGIKFESFEAPVANWVRNVIGQQGGIMLEPYYNNVLDFGMEFQCQKQSVRYCGLSVFSTDNGFYNGNVVAPESYKLEIISSMIAPERLLMVREAMEKILSSEMGNGYSGPLGVDMMIVRMEDGSFRLHPMVEINVRRTMGHVSLSLFGRLPYELATVSLSGGMCSILPISSNPPVILS